MSDLIRVENLFKRYGEVEAVSGISFSVPAGQICGYLGPNGAGKSTTMRMLAGLLEPSSGEVFLAGRDMVRDPIEAKRRLGFVPESGALYTLLSAREHLALVSDLHELEPARAAADTARLFELFGLAKLADRRIDTLSKGQKQKVALSTAFLHAPEVLILDEPLNGLDVEAARALKQLMQELAARGGAILYSSHILDVVERVCDRAIIIHRGRVLADAPTRELVGRSREASLEAVFHELVTSASVEGLQGVFDDGSSS
jgi:ABC-2 type transport system ATP-binding protein